MKEVKLTCPMCGHKFTFKNYWVWVFWYAPCHFIKYNYTKCPSCMQRSWMKRETD